MIPRDTGPAAAAYVLRNGSGRIAGRPARFSTATWEVLPVARSLPSFEATTRYSKVQDLEAALQGRVWRVVIPGDNLLDVNRRELGRAFRGHPMFHNFGRLLDELGLPAGG